jgi:hypothetical protein
MEVAEASKQKFIQFWVEEMPGMPKLHYQHYLLNINSDRHVSCVRFRFSTCHLCTSKTNFPWLRGILQVIFTKQSGSSDVPLRMTLIKGCRETSISMRAQRDK